MALLLSIIRSHVMHVRLAQGEAVKTIAADVFQDAVFEALAHADRFDPGTSPRAWFLAIVVNILKRKKAEVARRSVHEVYLADLYSQQASIDDENFFEHLCTLTQPGPEQYVEVNEQVAEMLSLVSLEDQQILRLAFLHDLDTRALAQALAVTPGAARVRLHRALHRLRLAYRKRIEHEEGETNHA